MSDITVASTTDSQEDVSRAAGHSEEQIAAEKKAETTAAETKTEEKPTTEGKETAAKPDEKAGKAEAGKEAKPPKKVSNVQKRIDTLTGRNYTLTTEVERLRKEVERLSSGKTQEKPAETEEPAQKKARPKLEDFETHEDWVDALTDWKLDQKLTVKQETEQQQAENQRLETVYASFNKQLETARGAHEDYDEKVGAPDAKLLEAAQLAIIELDNGAEVAYYLATHPEEREKINKMSNMKAVAYIGKISAALPAEEATETGDEETAGDGETADGEETPATQEKPKEEAKPAVVPKKPASKAPAPVTPVGGSSTKSEVPLDELPYEEYRRVREQQEASRRR